MDLNTILAQLPGALQQSNVVAQVVQDVGRSNANLEDENASIYGLIGNNESIIAGAKGASDLRIQQSRLRAAAINGTDLSSDAEQMSALTQALDVARTQQAAAREAVTKKQSSNLLTNPLQWLTDQLTINTDIAAYNQSEASAELIAKRIAEKNALTQTQIATQNALSTSVTAASLQAEQDKIKQQATIAANKSKIQGAQYNAEGILRALNISRDALGLQFQALTATNAEQNMKISLAHLDIAKKNFQRLVEDKKVEDSVLLEAINAGMKLRLGPDTPELTEKDSKAALLMARSAKPNQFTVDLNTGMEYLATGIKRYAANPSEALNIMTSGVRYNLPPAMEPLKQILATARDEVVKGTDKMPFDPKDVQGNIAKVNQRANDLLTSATREVKPGTGNPFEIPDIRTLIKHSPAVANSPVVTKVLLPQLQAGVDLSSPDKQFAAIVQAVKEGKLDMKEALDATTIYQVGVRTNLEARQMHSLGFTPPGDGSWYKYNVRIQTDPDALFSRTEVVDLTKPDLFSRALMKNLMAQKKSESLQKPNALGVTN